MGKLTISMAMFNSYVKLPEGMSYAQPTSSPGQLLGNGGPDLGSNHRAIGDWISTYNMVE